MVESSAGQILNNLGECAADDFLAVVFVDAMALRRSCILVMLPSWCGSPLQADLLRRNKLTDSFKARIRSCRCRKRTFLR